MNKTLGGTHCTHSTQQSCKCPILACQKQIVSLLIKAPNVAKADEIDFNYKLDFRVYSNSAAVVFAVLAYFLQIRSMTLLSDCANYAGNAKSQSISMHSIRSM